MYRSAWPEFSWPIASGAKSHCPPFGKHFRLFKNSPRRLCLLVGRILVLAKDTLDQYAKMGAHGLTNCPVNRQVVAHGSHQFAGDGAQDLVAQDPDGTVIGLKRVIKGELVLGESHCLASGVRLAQLAAS